MKPRFASLRQVLAALILGACAFSAAAEAFPLSYAGRLVQPNGAPVVGPVNLIFAFYTDPEGGAPLGPGAIPKTGVPLTSGMFQVDLEVADVDVDQIFANPAAPVYIQVTDTTSDKIYPRQKFSVVPYALRVPVDKLTIDYNAQGELEYIGSNALPPGGLSTDYMRGDGSWVKLDTAAVTEHASNKYFTDARAQAAVAASLALKENTANKGVINGYAGLDGSGRVPVAQIPFSGISYKGAWNATTNASPTLTSGACGTQGEYYIVATGGNTDLNGNNSWGNGDWAICGGGGAWQKVGSSTGIASVNGQIGPAVLLDADAVAPTAARKYYPDADAAKVAAHDSILAGAGVDNAEFGYLNGVTSGIQAQIDALGTGKAASSHTHGNGDITGLDAGKLTGTVDPARYSAYGDLVAESKIGTAAAQVAAGNHNHDATYSAIGHNHDAAYSLLGHNHDAAYATIGHNHNASYAALSHAHSSLDGASGGPANSLVVDNAGRIGIGTTSPTSKLDIKGGALRLQDRGDGFGAHLSLDVPGDVAWHFYATQDNGDLRFYQNRDSAGTSVALTRMVIDETGDVGIGTTAPDTKLHVAGQVKITGGTPGAGKILTSDANGLATWQTAGGKVAQVIYAQSTATSATSSNVPPDNTIPQLSEGATVLTANITPTSTANKVRIRANIVVSPSTANVWIIGHLHRNSGANAISTGGLYAKDNGLVGNLIVEFIDSPSSVAQQTYAIVVGGNGGTVCFNASCSTGGAVVNVFGGTATSSLVLEEIIP